MVILAGTARELALTLMRDEGIGHFSRVKYEYKPSQKITDRICPSFYFCVELYLKGDPGWDL